MSAPLPCEQLKERVIDTGLCTRCGTCVGACPEGNLSIPEPLGACLPAIGGACTACGLCLAACPGESVEFERFERELFGAPSTDNLLGTVRRAYLAYATDEGLRRAGSSGGVVTALLLDLLRSYEIDGSILYTVHEDEPWRGEGRIVSDEEGIRRSVQSRYHLSPMNTALRDLSMCAGSIAYVGLGCHVHGLRKLLSRDWSPGVRIDPVIGVYCGNNLYFDATHTMCRKLGVRDIGGIEALSYRAGRWPGFFAVRTAGGGVKRISKLEFNQAIPFYINRRCLFCIDLTNELTDISVGDGWAKEQARDGGWSVVLERTERGAEVLKNAVESGTLHLEEIDPAMARCMHAHAFDLKKWGAFHRLGLWRRWGYHVPRYDRKPPDLSPGRKLAEFFVSLQFVFCSSYFGRLLFTFLPLGPLGRFFRWLRRVWIYRAGRDMN
ncbi:MAG: Coenzyme F420 hydrogenase/dehydrogenase, beta subunit C-terminal domain [bacterium]|nr:MAG: Coenzyme F420 hydrogenase/dehydrogenase, beta subunit C-terminal domain [bacterium]